ncbi:hypothetical protein NHF40_02530 [Maricaulaceae bacterium EIL42A08]|nr:hypothetical protein [Maricaulaceae bacterium EIL42A08]
MMERLDQLQDPAARDAASAYLSKLDESLAARRKPVRADVRAGVEAHILEAIEHDASADAASLQKALTALGEPVDFASDWADAVEARYPQGALEQGVEFASARGRLIGQALASGLCVILGFVATLGLIGRLVAPESVGVFVLADGEIFIGTWTSYYAAIERDVVGAMTVPMCLALAALFFALGWIVRPRAMKK